MKLYQHIEILWEYMQLKHKLKPADCLFVMCSNDLRVAEHAAKIYHQKFAPLIVFSGGEGRFTDGLFERSEAETFADIAKLAGVPSEAILLETKSSNSGENVRFTELLLKEKGISCDSLIWFKSHLWKDAPLQPLKNSGNRLIHSFKSRPQRTLSLNISTKKCH